MFRQSPETTLAAMGAALGLVTFLAGSIFDSAEAIKLGITIIGIAAVFIGTLARSERQHTKDVPAVKQEINQTMQQAMEEEKTEITRLKAELAQIKKPSGTGGAVL